MSEFNSDWLKSKVERAREVGLPKGVSLELRGAALVLELSLMSGLITDEPDTDVRANMKSKFQQSATELVARLTNGIETSAKSSMDWVGPGAPQLTDIYSGDQNHLHRVAQSIILTACMDGWLEEHSI